MSGFFRSLEGKGGRKEERKEEMLGVEKVREEEGGGEGLVEGSSGEFISRRGAKTDSMDVHRHTDPGPPNAITLCTRKTCLYRYGAGRHWDRILR